MNTARRLLAACTGVAAMRTSRAARADVAAARTARSTRTAAVLALAATLLTTGCTTLIGRSTQPLLAKRDEPGVELCLSERTDRGGIRIVGRLNQGIYPITRASIQYRTAGASDPVPATTADNGRDLVLVGPRTEKVAYRKGATEVSFTVDPEAARALGDKVIWYRWIIDYDRGGSPRTEATAIHRTSVAEAGLPRATAEPGPDSSVVMPGARQR